MNVEKAKKRIAKRVKMGFKGYPQLTLMYFGESLDLANEVIAVFVLEDGASPQEQRFSSKGNVREDEFIQSALVKIIERTEAKSVLEVQGTSILPH
ncbi:hypothetical protein MSP8886_03856 [Marinomonas spartinae]|uniref:Uncharacterized protein n=1 Tax=Marinomonas spartinae TaxID=1792290 RepID=A0A1A8TUC9_9GAMM|nr:hypothetical protein [Marinomonas spartinae]SBS36801.1 hypothetical protein MSP8886_03856 [Marinomonas spartinae]